MHSYSTMSEPPQDAVGQGGKGITEGCLGGVLCVGGVVGVVGAFHARDWAKNDFSGYETFVAGAETFAFVAGAVALLGLALIIAGLVRSK